MAQIICRNLAIGYDGKAIVQNMNFSVNQVLNLNGLNFIKIIV